MIPETALRQLVQRIYAERELAGCDVVFYGNGACRMIGYPFCGSPNSENVAIVIEELCLPDNRDGKGMEQAAKSLAGTTQGAATNPVIKNRSKLTAELLGAGASCGLTAVSLVGAAAGVAGEVPTGGASTFLTVASWIGIRSGGIQCLNGVVRVGVIFSDMDGDSLERADNGPGVLNALYKYGILLVDAAGIAAAAGSLPYALKNLWAVIERQKTFIARGLSFASLRRMNRLERLQVITDCLKEAGRAPEGAAALRQAALDARISVKTLEGGRGGLSVNHSETLRRIISDETTRRLVASGRDIISNVAGMGVSATPSEWTGSGSGSINWVIHLLDAGAPKIN